MKDSLFDLEEKIVVITGGLGQLGKQYCTAFSERGARVFALDQPVPIDVAKAKLGALADKVTYVPASVVDRESLKSALETIKRQAGVPSVLINNAAIDSPPGAAASENGPFEEFPESSFDKVMAVNVKGVMLCCQVFGAEMAECGEGSIINISSIYGVVSPDQRVYEYRKVTGPAFFKPIAYSASKSALLNMTRYLATYWAPRGVRVNTVTLAGVFNNQDKEFLAAYCPKVPLGRMARAEEYCGAMIFLASNASSYMTGSNLVVDGGFTAW